MLSRFPIRALVRFHEMVDRLVQDVFKDFLIQASVVHMVTFDHDGSAYYVGVLCGGGVVFFLILAFVLVIESFKS